MFESFNKHYIVKVEINNEINDLPISYVLDENNARKIIQNIFNPSRIISVTEITKEQMQSILDKK